MKDEKQTQAMCPCGSTNTQWMEDQHIFVCKACGNKGFRGLCSTCKGRGTEYVMDVETEKPERMQCHSCAGTGNATLTNAQESKLP